MGRIHSIETMGLLDGPGIRCVVFFQGCKLRCAYCHNPDTWSKKEGFEISPLDLFNKIKRYKSYFDKSGGGVTCSGGEPLLQEKFLLEFLKLCKAENINTAIDTAGYGLGNYEEILKYTDIVLLDIKHVDADGYKALTGGNIELFNSFLKALNKSNCQVIVRQVVVPGITDNYEYMNKLVEMIKRIKNYSKIELLPYHILGVNKYEALGLEYRLKDLNPMSKSKTKELENYLSTLQKA